VLRQIGTGAQCLQLARGGGPLARLGQHGRGSADVDLAAGILPALARGRNQFGRGDFDDSPTEQATAAGLAGAAQRAQCGRVDGDAVRWPGMARGAGEDERVRRESIGFSWTGELSKRRPGC
jgi:hypothetical protein